MVRDKKHRGEKTELGVVLTALGPLVLWLRKRWVLAAVTFLGSVVAVVGPFWLIDNGWIPVRVVAGSLAAVAIVVDRIADRYETRLGDITFRQSERSAEKAVDNVNIFVSEAIEAMFLEGVARTGAITALKRTLARCAAASIGDGSRASYYPMRRESGGSRILDKPSHATELGRWDRPDRPFVEKEDPDHEIWDLLERSDEEPEVRNNPELVYGVDWSKKKYDTFYSVPVKADTVQFGMLSVNNARVGAIGGPQRAAVLAMARIFALVISGQKGPKFLNIQAAYHRASVVASNVPSIRTEAEQ